MGLNIGHAGNSCYLLWEKPRNCHNFFNILGTSLMLYISLGFYYMYTAYFYLSTSFYTVTWVTLIVNKGFEINAHPQFTILNHKCRLTPTLLERFVFLYTQSSALNLVDSNGLNKKR